MNERVIGNEDISAQFSLGRITITPWAEHICNREGVCIQSLLRRHMSGDFGEIDPSNQIQSYRAIRDGAGDIESRYVFGTNTIRIVTHEEHLYTVVYTWENLGEW